MDPGLNSATWWCQGYASFFSLFPHGHKKAASDRRAAAAPCIKKRKKTFSSLLLFFLSGRKRLPQKSTTRLSFLCYWPVSQLQGWLRQFGLDITHWCQEGGVDVGNSLTQDLPAYAHKGAWSSQMSLHITHLWTWGGRECIECVSTLLQSKELCGTAEFTVTQ